MQREQEADHAALERGVAAMEAKIAGLDSQLRPDVIRARTAEIRKERSSPLATLVIAMKKRAQEAHEMARVLSPVAELRLARFHNDDGINATMQMSLLMRLERTSTPELLEHLEDAVAAKNLARVEAVRLEFHRRQDREEMMGRYRAASSKLEFPRPSRRSGPSAGSRSSRPSVRSGSPPRPPAGPTRWLA
jgi:hypothetical protein